MDIFLLYLWTRLDAIVTFAWVAVIVSGIVLSGCVIAWMVNNDMAGFGSDYEKKAISAKAAAFKAVRYAALPVIMLLLIPTQKDAAIIAGGWAAKQIATSEAAQQISSKTFALINGKLDEELAKLNEKEEK
jgi:hypothetical protein